MVKLHHDNKWKVLDGVSPRCPADVVNGIESTVVKTNWLLKVRLQPQTGVNAYMNLLRKVAGFVVRGRSHPQTNILSPDLDDWCAKTIEV